jgi:hypothetical protein
LLERVAPTTPYYFLDKTEQFTAEEAEAELAASQPIVAIQQ